MALSGEEVSASKPAMQLARIGDGPDSLTQVMHIPDGTEDGSYRLLCESRVRDDGTVNEFFCYGKGAPKALKNVVVQAGRRARFAPARVNGEAIEAYVTSMVLVSITLGRATVLAVANHGEHASECELEYSAPQRLSRLGGAYYFSDAEDPNSSIWMVLLVDENGGVVDRELSTFGRVPQRHLERVNREIDHMRFIPGQCGGKPRKMIYSQMVTW